MDICHLKNAELEAKHQKYKGRVVLRGDIVKDDSGSYAVFTEQGSSESQMTAAKIMDIISRVKSLLPNPLQDDSTLDDAKAGNDFWSITGEFIYRHHSEPRVQLYVPREESLPFPLKYIDVARNIYTSLDVIMEKILKIIGTWMEKENYQMHGQVSQDSFY